MQKRQISVLFLHTFDPMAWIPCSKIDKFSYFYHPSLFESLNLTLFSKSPYLTANIKINYETGCMGRFSEGEKKQISRTIARAKMELFVALVSSFQPLTNFTKNPNIDAMGVLNAPIEYYNIISNSCRWSN